MASGVTPTRKRQTITESIQISVPPNSVFDFLRCIANLRHWSWLRNIRSLDANLFQAEDTEGPCRFFWIEDVPRRRIILQKTQHKDAPCLVLSVSDLGKESRVDSQFSSFRITATQRLQLAEQARAIKRLLEGPGH